MISLELIVELEALSYPARMARIAELGRDVANAALWDELERGDCYERRLAAQSCATSRDGERAMRLIGDPSRLVRGLALEMASCVCDDAQIERLWPLLNRRQTRVLLKKLVKRRRQSAVDRFLEAQAQTDAPTPEWLAFASEALATRLLQNAFESASARDFRRLAGWQPRVALEHALALARALRVPNSLTLEKCNAVLGAAASFTDGPIQTRALELARELNRVFPLQEVELTTLIRCGRAQQVAELVLETGEKVALSFAGRVHKLQNETVIALLHTQSGAFAYYGGAFTDWAAILKRLPHSQRAALYEEFHLGWRDSHSALAPAIVALLPRELRHTEARRHLALPELRAQPKLALPYIAFLPADEAKTAAQPFAGDPDPELRALALAARVANVRFERASADEVLDLITARANEQDPVRGAMLGELASLPPTLWREDQLPMLARIQRQALDARDLSSGTAAHLQRLIVAQLPRFPEWAGVQIAELLKERGTVSFFNLQNRINDEQMRQIGPRLEPIFRAWARREHAPFLGAMFALGKRLEVWDAGAQLLVECVANGPVFSQCEAARILAKFRPDIWRELVPQLVAKDESWGTQTLVFNFLHLKRQDLLSPTLLGRSQPKGRFWTGKTRFVPSVQTGFWRWTPDQQATFELTLKQLITDISRDNPGVFNAINVLAQLPDIAPQRLLKLAQLSTKKPAQREAALRVLSRLDAGQGVPVLLESLDDERARIAIYGLRRALLEMPALGALAILRAVPLQKVTVAKEVLRLLGDLETPAALDFLFQLGATDLHRDARVALLRALWEHLEDARAWPLLEAAALSDDPAIATMAARTTAPRLTLAARQKLNALLATLLAHPEARVRLQVLENGAIGAISDPESQLLAPMLRALQSPVKLEYTQATRALWSTYAATHPQALGDAMRKVLPQRRALRDIVEILANSIALSPRHNAEANRAVLDALASDPLALHLRLKLALRALAPTEFGALVENLIAADALHAESFFLLCGELERRSFSSVLRAEKADDELQTRWRTAPSPLLRRLSLALLKSDAHDARGWTATRREHLESFRKDAEPLVSAAAHFTFENDDQMPETIAFALNFDLDD